MKEFLRHIFLPRESNNHRAKILHHKQLFFIIAILILGQFVFSFSKTNYSNILGISTNISTSELLLLTNQKRQEKGVQPLVLNEALSRAAEQKAKDMIGNNYWSHNSPTGVTPWVFIQKSGYEYIYAGENLARGFSNSEGVINAWMASSTHRENMLSQNYQEIGFAVVQGKLLGEDTTLVVEMFGQSPSQKLTKKSSDILNSSTSLNNSLLTTNNQTIQGEVVNMKPLLDVKKVSWDISIIILSIFIAVLILDMIIIERKKITRIVGHNLDHVIFLSVILITILIFVRGIVL